MKGENKKIRVPSPAHPLQCRSKKEKNFRAVKLSNERSICPRNPFPEVPSRGQLARRQRTRYVKCSACYGRLI